MFKNLFKGKIPERGYFLVDERGVIHTDASTYDSNLGFTGLGISYDGHAIIRSFPEYSVGSLDDTVNTYKKWLEENWIGLDGITIIKKDQLKSDFSSKQRTDEIISWINTNSSHKSQVNAAVACRNYERGVLKKGSWDLPTIGAINFIFKPPFSYGSPEYTKYMELRRKFKDVFEGGVIPSRPYNGSTNYWSSNLYSSGIAYYWNSHNDGTVDFDPVNDYSLSLLAWVLPVYTIK